MFWVCALRAILIVIVLALCAKIALMHKAMDEVCREMSARLESDTNTLISVSSGDRHIRRLAAQLNVQLRQLRAERRRLQSGDMELREAITNISHDLRTPLTAICGYLDLLEQEEKSADVERYLAFIANRTEALRQLTEELFRYSVVVSAPNSPAPEDVCLNSALEESVASYYAALNELGITPDIKMPEVKIIQRLDKAALSRIFGNILDNTLKYSDGDLTISLSDTGEIVFSNTASSLTEVQVGKLFNRFYTVEAARNGAGLGLAISRTLVEQMSGKISARYAGNKLSICIRFSEVASDKVPN